MERGWRVASARGEGWRWRPESLARSAWSSVVEWDGVSVAAWAAGWVAASAAAVSE
jgi:hypothetical protein